MRIRKLELHGFKSFPDRTVLHFDPGISCIVGPNGCGKSNVMDGLRWCIGEQSARSLRGSEMMDVIFAGSQERKPVGFAEVIMTLTSDGGEPFPGEYAQMAEVSVGRRLHRTGASEYLINQRRVRRRDVVDLFLDTGIGNNLYSFIEQGRIGKIVHARPEERRSLIDEAAGISRYKARRDEARERLAATSTQLDRAADVAEEMSRRVRALSRQVRKAARFRRLRTLIRHDEISLALTKYQALVQDRRALRGQLRQLEGELAAAIRGRARREADLKERREELAVVEQGVETWRDEVAELDARTRELAGTVSYSRERLDEIDAEESRNTLSLKQTQAQMKDAAQESEDLSAQLNDARERSVKSAQVLDDATVASEAAQAAVLEHRHDSDTAIAASQSVLVELQGLRVQLTTLKRQADALPERSRQLGAAVATAKEEQSRGEAQLDVLVDECTKAEATAEQCTVDHQASSASSEAASTEENDAARALRQAEHERDAAASRAQTAARDLESARRLADDALIRARSDVENRVSAALQALDVRAAQRREALRRDQQSALTQARQRADMWVRTLQEQHSRRDVSLRAELDAADALHARSSREAQDQLQADAELALSDALQELAATLAGQVMELESAVEQGTDALAAASRAVDDGVAADRDAGAELAGCEAKVAALTAMIAARQGEDSGLKALTQILGPRPTLAEALSPSARSDAGLLALLGPLLELPVLNTEDELRSLAKALPDGAAVSIVMRPAGELDRQAALGALYPAKNLADALSHAQTAGGSAVTPAGIRARPDGVVVLGAGESGGAQLVAQLQDLESAKVSLDHARERRAERANDLDRLIEARDALDARTAEAREALDHVKQTQSDRADAIRQRQRLALDQDRRALEEQAVARRAEAAAHRRERLDASQAEHRASLEFARSSAEAAIERVAEAGRSAETTLEEQLGHARLQEAADAREAAEQGVIEAEQARSEAKKMLEQAQSRAESERAASSTQIAAARERLDAARTTAQQARLRDNQASTAMSDAVLKVSQLASRRDAVRATVARAISDGEERAKQLVRLQGEEAELVEATAQVQASVAHAEVRSEQAIAIAETHKQSLARALTEAEQAAAALGEVKVASVTWIERVRSLQAALAANQARVEQGSHRLSELQAALALASSKRQDVSQTLRDAEAELTAVNTSRAESWDKLERERTRLKELREGVQMGEEDLRALGDSVGELTRTSDQVRARVETTKEEIDGLRTRIEERYQQSVPGMLDRLDAQGSLILDVDPAVQQGVEIDGEVIEGVMPLALTSSDLVDEQGIAERVDNIATHRKALDRLGDVNLAAFDEWAEVRERHNELEIQRADLETSVARIRSAIAKMNRTCRQRFRDTFDLVNAHFQEMYPRLVGGGSARLSLTDEEDLLETGVDIFVQPPGKRLQNLSLLSGGEKAMTAIALILSLFKVKPSPFCVLDEVDAPLDEANGSRFNEALKEMSSASQFIVVTHNRKTMECASTLYGVTMPDPGCSRLVSVRLGE